MLLINYWCLTPTLSVISSVLYKVANYNYIIVAVYMLAVYSFYEYLATFNVNCKIKYV